MNRNEFMYFLRSSLEGFSQQEREEIIYDYEEHFAVGMQSGKTEAEICFELGDPRSIGNQYRSGSSTQSFTNNSNGSSIIRAIFASLGLGLFNLIFILGPFLAVAATLISLLLASCCTAFAGILGVFMLLIKQIFPQFIPIFDFSPWISGVLYCIAITCAGTLLYMLTSFLAKGFFKGTSKYLKMNLNIITGRR